MHYDTNPPYSLPIYFKLPIHVLEDYYHQGWYIEDCEEAIEDVNCSIIEFGFDDFILKWQLADTHDNPRLWVLYMQILGIDGATAGLLENKWQQTFAIDESIILTDEREADKQEIATLKDWQIWKYERKT